MIRTISDKESQKIYDGGSSSAIPKEIQHVARRKLRMIDAAVSVNDLRIPPGNHLEKLKGNLEGFYSIRINDQYRIIFRYETGDAYDVKITDYH